jgi:hypothetical protein
MEARKDERCAVVVAVASHGRATLYGKVTELVREHEGVYHI